jgi:hypothetical protein
MVSRAFDITNIQCREGSLFRFEPCCHPHQGIILDTAGQFYQLTRC